MNRFNELVGKVMINLLRHAKFITSHKISCLCNQHNYHVTALSCLPKQIDLTSAFVTTAVLSCQHVIVSTWL